MAVSYGIIEVIAHQPSKQGIFPACIAQRLRADSACALTCPARLACPVGPEHRYSSAQMAHSYGISLAMLREYAARTG